MTVYKLSIFYFWFKYQLINLITLTLIIRKFSNIVLYYKFGVGKLVTQ